MSTEIQIGRLVNFAIQHERVSPTIIVFILWREKRGFRKFKIGSP